MSQESEFNYSLYVSSEDDEARQVLAARPINKEILIKTMSGLGLEGQWRVSQTACGLIISFMLEQDLQVFQEELDLSAVLGLPACAISFSSLETYRQRVLIKEVPWVLSTHELEAALNRQGIYPISLFRTRNNNVILELGEPEHFNKLLQDGFDFYDSARFAVTPLPGRPPAPLSTPFPLRDPLTDDVLQCFKCQGFWHFAGQCMNGQRCVRCGDAHKVADCPRPRNDPICVHCTGRHHAAARHCPVRQHYKNLSFCLPFMPPYLPSYLPPFAR